MDLLTIAVFVLSILGAVALKFVVAEIQDWMPLLARRIIDRAVSHLPEHEQERYREEWYAHLDECPGTASKRKFC
jgi:hypothetical protein